MTIPYRFRCLVDDIMRIVLGKPSYNEELAEINKLRKTIDEMFEVSDANLQKALDKARAKNGYVV